MDTRSKMYTHKKREAGVGNVGDSPQPLTNQIQFPVKQEIAADDAGNVVIDELHSDGTAGAFGATEAVQE